VKWFVIFFLWNMDHSSSKPNTRLQNDLINQHILHIQKRFISVRFWLLYCPVLLLYPEQTHLKSHLNCLYIVYMDIVIMSDHEKVRDIKNPLKKHQSMVALEKVISSFLKFIPIYYYSTYIDITHISDLIRSQVQIFNKLSISQLEWKRIFGKYYSQVLVETQRIIKCTSASIRYCYIVDS